MALRVKVHKQNNREVLNLEALQRMHNEDRAAGKTNVTGFERVMAGAERYAAADRSDPFTAGRVMAHLKSGVAVGYDKENKQFYGYDAEHAQERRSYEDAAGTHEFTVPAYINIKRA